MSNSRFFIFISFSVIFFCNTIPKNLDFKNGNFNFLLLGRWELDYESTLQELLKENVANREHYQELYFIYLSKIKKEILQANLIFEKTQEAYIWKSIFHINEKKYEGQGIFEFSLLEKENQSIIVSLQDNSKKETEQLKIIFKDINFIEVWYLARDQELNFSKAIFKRVEKKDEI